MRSELDRRHVREVVLDLANTVSPAISYGRNKETNLTDENFVLSFFLTRTPEELSKINSLVDSNEDEVLVLFFQERANDSPKELTADQKKTFDFDRKDYKAHRLEIGFDELREIEQPMLAITFAQPE